MPTIDNLVLEIESNSADAEHSLGNLAKALAGLRIAASNQRSLNVVAKGVRAIADASNSLSQTGVKSLNEMTNALKNMGALKDVKLSSSFASQIKGIGDAAKSLYGIDWSSVKELSTNLEPLSNIQKATNLNNVVNTLKKLPSAIESVNNIDSKKISEFADKVDQLRVAIRPLADEMRAVSAGFSSLPKNIQKAIKANEKLTESNKKAKKSFSSLVRNVFSVGAAFYVLQRGVDTMMSLFEKSNQYEEVLNMTSVSLGKNADAALRYADQVERLAGINQVEWLTNVGTLNQMFQGFGIGADAAAHMSQQLTQLAYDIQSVYNVSDLQEVMRRLQSGITGEVEGMRRYGVELSNASMQEFLLARGIDVKVSSLSMAEKAAVRYNMIMTKTSNIQGDLARTIENPANALRILQAQLQVAGRYLGQIVSIIAAKVIPWIQAFTRVIANAAQALANLWGYALPNIGGDRKSITGNLDDITDSVKDVGGSAGSAKDEIKGLLASFDELNVIQQEKSGGGGGGGSSQIDGFGGLDWLDDYGYDFLNGINSQVDNLVEKIKGFLPIIGTVTAALAGWKIADAVADFFGSTNPMWGLFAATQIIEIALVWDAVSDMFENGLTPKNVIEWISGALVGSVGGWALTKDPIHGLRLGFGMALMATAVQTMKESFTTTDDGKSIGLAIVSALEAGVSIALLTGSLTAGLVATPIIAIAAIVTNAYIDNKNEAKEKLKSAFGDINLSSEEVTEMVALLTAGAVADIQLSVSGWKDVEATKSTIEQMLIDLEYDMRGLQIRVDTSPEVVQSIADSVTQITDDAKKLLNQQSIAGSFSLDLLFGKGSEESKSMTATGTQIRSAYSDYVEGLAGEFNAYLSEAINDGELTVDEQAKAMEIYSSWKNAIDIARGMARQDKLNQVSIDLALSGNLSKESVDAAAEQIRAEKDAAWHDVTYSLAQVETQLQVDVQMAYELYSSDPTLENFNQWEDAKNRLEVWNENLPNIIAEKKVEFDLEWEAIEWAIYEPAIKAYSDEVFFATQSGMSENLGNKAILLDPKLALDSGSTSESVRKIAEKQVAYYRDGFVKELSKQNVDTESVGKIFAGQMQSIANNQKIIKEAREAGQIPAKEYIEAYKGQMMLGAMAGDKSAIDYVIGSLMIGQSGFFDLINTAKGAGADYAGAFGQGFIDSLNITQDEAGKWLVDFGNGMVLDIKNLSPTLVENLRMMGVDLSNIAPFVSQEIESGLEISSKAGSDAIVEASSRMKTALKAEVPSLESTAESTASAVEQKLKISPKVDTSNADRELVNWKKDVITDIENTIPTLNIRVVVTKVSEIINKVKNTIPSVADEVTGISGNKKTTAIPKFASGGFPTEGQLFISREAGPEMVGQIGGRTAVANNAQIVQGVASGVSQANSEQNTILRQAIRLLENIASKEFTAEVRPSAALGKTVKRSIEMNARVSG